MCYCRWRYKRAWKCLAVRRYYLFQLIQYTQFVSARIRGGDWSAKSGQALTGADGGRTLAILCGYSFVGEPWILICIRDCSLYNFSDRLRQRLHGADWVFGRSNIWPFRRSVHTWLANRPQITSLRRANIRPLSKATLCSVHTGPT